MIRFVYLQECNKILINNAGLKREEGVQGVTEAESCRLEVN